MVEKFALLKLEFLHAITSEVRAPKHVRPPPLSKKKTFSPRSRGPCSSVCADRIGGDRLGLTRCGEEQRGGGRGCDLPRGEPRSLGVSEAQWRPHLLLRGVSRFVFPLGRHV